MNRVVIDANIVVSAAIREDGASAQILRAFTEKQNFAIISSELIFAEWRRSLSYPRIRKRLKTSPQEVDTWIASLGLLCEFVEPRLKLNVIREDPDDNKYLEAALEGHAQYIVSGDKHLLSLRGHEDVQIVPPRQFLTILSSPVVS